VTPDELRMELLESINRCTDPDQASRLLADACEMLAAAAPAHAARRRFWDRLYGEILSLAHGTPMTSAMDEKWLVLTVAQSEIDHYRHE
jgi:hypothetical protein